MDPILKHCSKLNVSKTILQIRRIQRCAASSTAASTQSRAPLVLHRTAADPNSFTTRNIGQWYTIPSGNLEKLSYMQTLPKIYRKQVETLFECSFMVRLPFVDIVNCLRHTNLNAPVVRYVLYGADGTGKSCTLWQTVNWAHANGWVVVYVPVGRDWNRHHTLRPETMQSEWKAERLDIPFFAVQWLTRFKIANEHLINEQQLVTETKNYIWTARENTPIGSSLMSVVELGISRPKLASDCLGAVLRELKHHANKKKIKVLVAVDMANSFFTFSTQHRRPDGSFRHASEISLVHNMTKMLKNDWTNGAVAVTVDNREIGIYLQPPFMPYYLLGQEGFKLLDPFIPIEHKEYTEHEANNCLDYYIEKKWLQNPTAKTDEGKKEIIHLSAFHPSLLERYIAPF